MKGERSETNSMVMAKERNLECERRKLGSERKNQSKDGSYQLQSNIISPEVIHQLVTIRLVC